MNQLPTQFASTAKTALLPQNYQAAKRAIAESEHIDECTEWAGKTAAIPPTHGRLTISSWKLVRAGSGRAPFVVAVSL